MRGRFVAAALMALLAVGGYFCNTATDYNEVTGETQRVALSEEQEVAMGLQAAPQMAAEYGGLLPDERAQAALDAVGTAVVRANGLENRPYRYDFHLLADPNTVNAFALPGGQVFITAALASRLETEGQLAGILGHEVGHVVARHSAEQMAKAGLLEGLANAGAIATYDPGNPSGAYAAQMIGQMMNMRYGRDDELESDRLGVRFMVEAGYDPRALIRVMQILEEASGGGSQPEFLSTHPNPGNRIEKIEAAIRQLYPNGLPTGLKG